jgi:hypothetical protein
MITGTPDEAAKSQIKTVPPKFEVRPKGIQARIKVESSKELRRTWDTISKIIGAQFVPDKLKERQISNTGSFNGQNTHALPSCFLLSIIRVFKCEN